MEIRLRVDLDGSWFMIKRPGETKFFDLPDDHVGAAIAFFPEQGGSAERFRSFVSAIERRFAARAASKLY